MMQIKVYTTDLEEVQNSLAQIVSVLQLAYGTATEEVGIYGHNLPGLVDASINTIGIAIQALNTVLNEIQATLEEDVK